MKCVWKITGIHKWIGYWIHFLEMIPNKINFSGKLKLNISSQKLWLICYCIQIFMLKKYCLHLLETPEFLMLDWNSDSRSENCRLTWFTRCLQVKHSTITGFFQNKTPHISMVKVSTILLYTCQFSDIMHESHACGLNTSISCIKDNLSHLTHKSGQIVLDHVMTLCPFMCSNEIKVR